MRVRGQGSGPGQGRGHGRDQGQTSRSPAFRLSRRGFGRALLGGALAGIMPGSQRLSAASAPQAPNPAPTQIQARAQAALTGPVAMGAYLPDAVYDRAVLNDFAAAIGRQPDFLIWYEGWSGGDFGAEQAENLQRLESWGLVPVIAWDPFDPVGPTINQPAYALANIIRGDFDAYVESWAEGLAAYGNPVFLNFAHEMNGNWYPWGVGVNGNQPGEFITAWRRIHDRFTAAGAANVRWVWTPNEMYEDVPAAVEAVYPGDAYVDWFGMNGFNWGADIHWESCDCQSAWRTFHEIFEITYRRLTALADKPIMIGEVASSEVGGNKAAWITDAYLEQLPNQFPRIRAISWFNKIATGLDMVSPGIVEPTTTSVDWRVNSSPASLQAFSEAVNTPYFQGSLL